jgi:predicted AlkP superfamily phosphohydrolase/phosphomutase
MQKPRGRVIVLGMDGLAWPVIDALVGQGRLPHFRHAMAAGVSCTLHSTIPPLTPAAWSTLFSGLPPAQHGVFDFTAREAGSYSFRLCSSADRRAEMIWARAGAMDRTVAVVNVPMTYPAPAVNGVCISGMDAPELAGAVSPGATMATLLATSPDYTIDAMSHWFTSRDTFLTRLRGMHQARHRLILHLLDEMAPDLFIAVYVIADRVQHVVWSMPLAAEVIAAYESLDLVLGDLLSRLGPDDVLLLISDHGFQGYRSEICLNRVLADAGLLVLDRSRCLALLEHFNHGRVHTRSQDLQASDWWCLPPRALWFDMVDWSRTRCAAYGLIGNLMINLRGREVRGTVAPGDQERLLDEVRALVVEAIHRLGHDVPVGLHRIEWDRQAMLPVSPPDAVLEIDGYRIGTWGGRELYAPAVLNPAAEGHTGTHSAEGVCLALGAGIPATPRRGTADATAITPTILDLLALPPDPGLPGTSLLR